MKGPLTFSLVVMFLAGCGTTTSSPPPESPSKPADESIAPRADCAITIVGVPSGVVVQTTDAVPPGSQLLAVPADFDPDATSISTAEDGSVDISLRLRGDAVERFATYTKAHVDDQLAILVNGHLASVPRINESIRDGQITVSEGGPWVGQIRPDFAACAVTR